MSVTERKDSTFRGQRLLRVPAGITLPEKKAIISLYGTNWLVYVTETAGVYCAVRTGSLTTRVGTLIVATIYLQLILD